MVYGDIGTSPIYALREALRAAGGDAPPAEADVTGVLSIIVWSLTLVVTVKYALIVLRADNRGEGGTLSLMALARKGVDARMSGPVLVLGVAGAALFYGDALITPAISVLSAVEGMEVVAPGVEGAVVPVTVAIIAGLFAVQRFGTARVAVVFGPVTAIWFLVLGGVGLWHIVQNPAVLLALDPRQAAGFLIDHRGVALVVMGAAFLAVTGAEALYADLGHFGRRPIVLAWFALVFPALVLNYFGQGAYVLGHGGAVGQPLFEMVPGWAGLPMVVLATAATVIASQAVISGTYSLTSQAIQLGMLPRMDILHTSASQSGQIYVPQVNLLLAVGVVILVLEMGSSSALASAYGISVTGEMIVTGLLLYAVMTGVWRWRPVAAAAVVAPLLALEGVFLCANMLKVHDGGYVSLAVAGALMLVVFTWRRGSAIVFRKSRKAEVPLGDVVARLYARPPAIVPGTAVFLTGDRESAPTALTHSLKHYKVLHEKNVILTLLTAGEPHVAEGERVAMEEMNPLFMRVTMTFGYMERPNVPKALAVCRRQGWKFDIMSTSFFLSRRSLKAAPAGGMPPWQDKLYILLARNASDATAWFQIPSGRVVEIGTQIVI